MIATQSLKHCVRSGVMRNHWLVPFRATYVGEKITSLLGCQTMCSEGCLQVFNDFSRCFFVKLFMLWSRYTIFLIFPLAGTVFSPGHWKSIWVFISCTPMFLPLCLVSSPRLNHLLHVELFKRELKCHKCYATCNVRGVEGVLAHHYLWRRWNLQQQKYGINSFFRHGWMKSLWDYDRFKLMPSECGFSFTILDIMSCPISDPAKKTVVICTIPFLISLVQLVLPYLSLFRDILWVDSQFNWI